MGLRDNRLNILVLNYEFPPIGGGAGVVAYDISKRLAEAGHRVTVVTMGFEQLPSYEEKDGMRIYRVKCIRKNQKIITIIVKAILEEIVKIILQGTGMVSIKNAINSTYKFGTTNFFAAELQSHCTIYYLQVNRNDAGLCRLPS